MLLYILRHGETDWNAEARLQGQHDVSLNENGRKLAEITGKGLADIQFDLIITSPLIRAVETARIVTGYRDIPMLTDDRIRELSWGDWDGISAREAAYEKIRGQMFLFYRKPWEFAGAPGGETLRELCIRTSSFLEDLIRRKEYADKTILISTHGCAVRGLLNSLYQNPEDFWQGGVPRNCSVTVVRVLKGHCSFVEKDKTFYDISQMDELYENSVINQS